MQPGATTRADPALWQAVLFPALAGGLGWGIRGQYGHETGAMIAGVLLGLTLAALFGRGLDPARVLRAVALGTVAIGLGGSMTYGQTIGLTQDAALVGNRAALGWGMLGLAIKGSIWFGFAGAFLGIGLGGSRPGSREMGLTLLGLMLLCLFGIWLLNEPYDPASRVLPRIYFSDDWRWEPGTELKPRREVWGGLLLALLGLLAWRRWGSGDALAARLGLWGMAGGAVGFPLGQSLQTFHAWNPELFRSGIWVWLDPRMNWWNWMETTFGAVAGALLGLGLWRNRGRIGDAGGREPPPPADLLPAWLEASLLGAHVTLLFLAEVRSVPGVEAAYDFGLVMAFLPLVAVAGGRWAPWLVVLPITLLPIAAKTAAQGGADGAPLRWGLLFVLPVGTALALAWWLARQVRRGRSTARVLGAALLFTTWTYFFLNFHFFHFPWPWQPWTVRTPNALVFAGCAAGLTWLAVRTTRAARHRPDPR